MLRTFWLMTHNRLRIDASNCSPAVEYRIENGQVERRSRAMATEVGAVVEREWQRLTREQLTSETGMNPVFANWLRRRLGILRSDPGLSLP
jgi:hypothetical protein